MTPRQFQRRIAGAMRTARAHPEVAARSLLVFDDYDFVRKHDLSSWHIQQALALAGMFLERAGRRRRAARVYERLARHCRGEIAYWGRAAANAYALAAIARLQAGDGTGAMLHANEALAYQARYPQKNPAFTTLHKLVESGSRKRKTRGRAKV